MEQYSAIAGPSTWGPWVSIVNHIGVATFKITAGAIGDTIIRNRVRYFRTGTKQVTEEWRDEVIIKCGNAVASVEVSFMGVPLGTAVEGTVL